MYSSIKTSSMDIQPETPRMGIRAAPVTFQTRPTNGTALVFTFETRILC